MKPAVCRDCLRHGSFPTGDCPHCGGERVFAHDELDALDIAHVDCDAFYASVEKRDNPSLADKPLLIGHPGGRGVVTTACYIARQYGCRSAMPMFKALKLCPDAVVLPPDMAKYKAISAEVRDCFAEITDLFEPVSIDEAYLDLGVDHRKVAQPPAALLARLAQDVERHCGITISCGLSANKFLAKLASDLSKPRGFSVIGAREAAAFLAPLPVSKIHGVGAATAARMEAAGWLVVGDLQALSERELCARFGRFGRSLAQFVHGCDSRPVKRSRPAKSISAETTFSANLHAYADLRRALEPLCGRVAIRLKANRLAGRTVTLKLKTKDFEIATRRVTLKAPTQRAEVVLAVAERLLQDEADGVAFRLIGVTVSDLGSEAVADPPTLFDKAR